MFDRSTLSSITEEIGVAMIFIDFRKYAST